MDGGTWKKISANNLFTCGIKSDDTLRCWGANGNGQLGDNSTTYRSAPTAVSGGGTWKDVATGSYHTCAIKMDDTAWCWGQNGNGQLGIGTTGANVLVPTAVSGGHTWKKMARVQGGYHNCAIRMDDTAWCWGADSSGSLGNGAAGQSTVPIIVDGGYTWKLLSTSCGMKSDDTMWCWGSNGNGALGIASNDFAARQSPIQVATPGTWKILESNGLHSCAIKIDDTMWCWGSNSYAQLTASNSSPYSTSGLSPLCVNPTRKAGSIAYNSTHNVLQLCNGVGWIALSASYVITDPCAGSPAPGTVCDDGTIYAGLSPDGNVKMFTVRCDHGQSWNGSTCTGSRSYHAWSDSFSAGYTDTTITNCATSGACNALGESNAAILMATDADPGTGGFQYHDAANICDTKNENGKTDWYLPSIPELAVLYSNRTPIGEFNSGSSYWASSEVDASNAWSVPFNTGTPVQNDKTSITHIRCVRK